MNPPRKPAGAKERGAEKVAKIPVKVITQAPTRKPAWIRAKAPTHPDIHRLKGVLREHGLHTVCEEASCPNLGECFSHGTATFMIMGDICTRRCPFCDVAHGRPLPLNEQEPTQMATVIAAMGLRYVVITSVDRDDLRDGGAAHFTACIAQTRALAPGIQIEILTPDFRGRVAEAVEILVTQPPDVFNHNLETVPRLYKSVRPGADYAHSLGLIQTVKQRLPTVPTKSGLMLGVGETLDEVAQTMRDLRAHGCDMLTLGQYLQPTRHHLPVVEYLQPQVFTDLARLGEDMGFKNVASGPMVRSSYHADLQAAGRLTPQE